MARLRADIDDSAAANELRAINKRLFPVWSSSYQDDRATWSLEDLKDHVVGDVGTRATVGLGAVGLMWLIACANAANLLLARVISRGRELALRTALGASRIRVIRLLLAEGVLLSLGCAAIGIGVTLLGTSLLQHFGRPYLPRLEEVTIDIQLVWVLAGVTLASAAIFALVPALHGTGGSIAKSLRSMDRSATGSAGARRLRRLVVGGQFAVVTPLLIVGGLLAGTMNELSRVNLGFDTRHVIAGRLTLPSAQYPTPAAADTFWDALRRRVDALPGVAGVTFSDGLPPDGVGNFNNFDLEERPTPPGQSQPVTPWVAVTPDYFRVLGLSLLEGRVFDERDGRDPDVDVIVVDRAWARRFFPDQSAVGKRLVSGGCTTCPLTTVVGVVSDVKYAGLDKPDDGSAYAPLVGGRFRNLVMRTRDVPVNTLPALRQILHELDPSIAFSNVATMDELVAASVSTSRFLSWLVGTLGVVALTLTTIGVYGVMAHHVNEQTRDVCIRLALGGRPRDLLRRLVSHGLQVVFGGVLVGIAAALLVTRAMSSLLFGVGTADPTTFVAVTAILVGVAVLASLVPAVRVVRVQPATILRGD